VTPEILQIHRERLRPGAEAAYAANEARITESCAELGCPHPYLGVESLTGPKEVWYFNGYASEVDKTSVAEAYARNEPLMEALSDLGKQKAAFILEPLSTFARYRPDRTAGKPWAIGEGRFLAISVSHGRTREQGTVFEDDSGTCYEIRAFPAKAEADLAFAGSEGTLFAVRPEWSHPAKEWIAADPAFWLGHPATRPRK
jgi:hypothetical protein